MSGIKVIEIPQSVLDSVNKRMAEEAGMTPSEYEAELERQEREDWCRCKEIHPTERWEDGECKLSYKHCYTCIECGKLVQIG